VTDLQLDQLVLTEFLPDTQRVSNPWVQVWRDMVAPPPISHWATLTTAARIHRYDQIRTFLSRGFLLAVLAGLLAFADVTSSLAWLLLLPGALQTSLEIYLDFRLNDAVDSKFVITRKLVDWVTDKQWERTLVNATGLLGAVAVLTNLLSVLFFIGSGKPGWVKLAALVLAILYGNSGILAVLIDATNYSVNQHLPKFVPVLRAHAWLLAMAALAILVGSSLKLNRWDQAEVPLAWAACLLPAAIGMKMRDYDRFLRASSEQAVIAMTESRGRLVQDLHDTLNEIRSLSRALERDESVRPEYKIAAADLAPKLTLAKEMADEQAWINQGKLITMHGLVEQLGRDHSLRLSTDLQFGELSGGNRDLVRQLITTVVTNAAQALDAWQHRDRTVSVSGYIAAGMIHVSIGDPLPLIEDSMWCVGGSTIAVMRDNLRGLGGDLAQARINGGKEIRGVWQVKRPPIKRESSR
jgi:hypothetical protein